VRSDRRLTLRLISSELNLNRFSVHQILTLDLDMRKVCAKMVHRSLSIKDGSRGQQSNLTILEILLIRYDKGRGDKCRLST